MFRTSIGRLAPRRVQRALHTNDNDSSKTPAAPRTGLDRRVWAPAAATLLIGTGVGVIVPLLPLFSRDIGVTPAEFGLVVSAFGASRLLSNFPASWASERYGRRPFLVGGPIVSGAAMMGVAAGSSFMDLFVLRFISGAGGAVFMGSGKHAMQCKVALTTQHSCTWRTSAPPTTAPA